MLSLLRTNSRATLIEAVRAGVGVGIVPCAYADADPMLVRRGAPFADLRAAVWVLMHPSVSKLPRVRAAASFLTATLRSAGGS